MISGRVPTIVATFMTRLDLPWTALQRAYRAVRIEDLAGPEQRDQFAASDVLDRVRVSRRNIDDPVVLGRRPRYSIVVPPIDLTEPDHRLALDHEELLGLGVVVVVPPRDTRPGPRHEDLSEPAAT